MRVHALHVGATHEFSKQTVDQAEVVAGIGLTGDCHAGSTVQHRSRVRVDPSQPNLRQVHLIGREQLAACVADGFPVAPGDLGENITTEGIDLHALPTGATLRVGDDVLLALTGLRNPCAQIDAFRPGLRARVIGADGSFRAGVMAVVVQSGIVRAGDPIAIGLPPEPHRPLARV